MLDRSEFARWLEASDDEGRLATTLVAVEAYNAVVLHCEQAAQLALKGLLRGVGAARHAWGHALPELADRAVSSAGLVITEDLAAQLAVLERDYKPSRYPDSLVSGTPRGNYGSADAIRAQAVLAALRDAVLVAWEELVAEMEGRGNAGGEEDPRTV